jgi:hypothetical protein
MRNAAVFAIPIVLTLFAACGSEEPVDEAQPTTSAPSEDANAAGGTVPEGPTDTSAGSCVEQYSIDTLKNRSFAFDGTIKSIGLDPADGPTTVVFSVQKWFKGGSGAEATKKAYGFQGVTSVGGGSDLNREAGQRVLVAGDEEFLWECGFTQNHDADVAAQWDGALS